MGNKYFEYINDKLFFDNVTKLVKEYLELRENYDIKNLFKNKLDPFHMLVQVTSTDNKIELDKFINDVEIGRQISKTLSNKIGEFHEKNISFLEGFEKIGDSSDTKKGVTQVDVINKKEKIVAEIKNKWNTVKGSDKPSIFKALKAYADNGYKAYYLKINDIKTKNEIWIFESKDIEYKHENIYEISVDAFLYKVTGDKDAFKKYIDAFILAIKDALYVIKKRNIPDDILKEFEEKIFKENYKTYE